MHRWTERKTSKKLLGSACPNFLFPTPFGKNLKMFQKQKKKTFEIYRLNENH